jgi:dishevelled associated activator of morphogenesis
MPSIEELDIKFAELVEELDLTAPNKAAMLSLPAQKKWQIYCSRKSPIDSTDGTVQSTVPPSPEHYIDRFKDMAIVSVRYFCNTIAIDNFYFINVATTFDT